ncbi:SCP-like protein [Ancylostoma caninum]|uniref:SCP-like protein n=1 Tax=Ancylostoma caninum TaxID=29170 RepID=A0A368G0M7_ANCCA|nr:SCP-like protein [Ancylostoma caninum]
MASVSVSTLAALLLLIYNAAAASKPFGCDGKISDEMRKKILDFHNNARVKLANGKEQNKTGRLPPAKNMYKLLWDCELEKKAQVAIANCPENLSDLQGYGTNFGKMYYCPRYPKPSEELVMNELNKWWGEARKYGMTDSQNRYIKDDMQGSMESWANMANGKNTKIGCSYNKIRSATVLLCAYDDNAVKDEKVIYEPGNPCKTDKDCTTYQGSKCGRSGLCKGTPEPGYKQKEEALERACNNETGMNEEIRKHLLDNYNKYRQALLAYKRGELECNAPKAEQMLKMIYDCPTEKVAFKLAKKCPAATRKIYSHNWNMHKASNSSMSDEEAADEATATWWSELKNNGVGESNILTPDLFNREYYSEDGVLKPISHYLAMAKDISYKLGCVIHTCNDGKYVHCLSSPTGPQPVNKPIYQATATWWSELKNNGVGESNILTPRSKLNCFTPLLVIFGRSYEACVLDGFQMAKDISYKLGCVIHTCNDGKYVHCLSSPRGPQPVNKPIYQVGEPCKKNSDCKGKFVCSVEEGLCSLF